MLIRKFKYLIRIWQIIRSVSGDDAYDIYLSNFKNCSMHKSKRLLSRQEFFLKELDKKWSGINRCC